MRFNYEFSDDELTALDITRRAFNRFTGNSYTQAQYISHMVKVAIGIEIQTCKEFNAQILMTAQQEQGGAYVN